MILQQYYHDRLRVTSATTGTSSTVSIADTDLFSSLTGYASLASAVVGTAPVYTATINVNGTSKAISIAGASAQTFTALVSELNTDIGAQGTAVLDVPNKQIKVRSLSTGPTATINITAGTLLPALANYTSLSPVQVGGIPTVTPKKSSNIGDYTNVVCTNIATFPKVTKGANVYPKCVQKCQQVRPPKCVDYNSELN